MEGVGDARAAAAAGPPGRSGTTAQDGTAAATDPGAVAAGLRLVVGRLARRLRGHGPEGLPPSQLSALAHLEEHGPQRLTELAGRDGVTAPTMTRVVDALAAAGLVERVSDPADARCSRVTPTSRGREVLASWRRGRTAVLTERIARLAPADVARVAAALPALEAVVRDLTDDPPRFDPTPHPTGSDRRR